MDDNINAVYDDSNLRLTMERYSYNLWALIALIAVIIILKILDQMYLYNMIVVVIVGAFFTVYFSYIKKK